MNLLKRSTAHMRLPDNIRILKRLRTDSNTEGTLSAAAVSQSVSLLAQALHLEPPDRSILL